MTVMSCPPELAETLEFMESVSNREYIERRGRSDQDFDGDFMTFPGGGAVYGGEDCPLSCAVGFGMASPPREADLLAIEDFYRRHHMAARIEVTSLSDPSLFSLLGSRGYRLHHFTHVWIKSLTDDAPVPPPAAVCEVVAARSPLASAWAQVTAAGFKTDGPPNAGDLAFVEGFLEAGKCWGLLASAGPARAAAAAMAVRDRIAVLFAASTLPPYRNRGLQSALIAHRLTMARDAGCIWAVLHTDPQGTSQRNASRMDFFLGYVKATMVQERGPCCHDDSSRR